MDDLSLDSEIKVLLCEECSTVFLSADDFKLHKCIKREVPSSSEDSRDSSYEEIFNIKSIYSDNNNNSGMSDKLVRNESGPSGSSMDVALLRSEIKSPEHNAQKSDVSKMQLSNQSQLNVIAATSKGCIPNYIVLGYKPVSCQNGSPRMFLVPLCIRPNVAVHNIQSQTLSTTFQPRPHVLRFNNPNPVHHVSSTEGPTNSIKLPTSLVKCDVAMPVCYYTSTDTTSIDASTVHGNRETGIDVKPYMCKTCSMVMDSERELEAHRMSCKGKKCVEVKVEDIQFSVCSERFSDESSFDKHREICSVGVHNTNRLAEIPAVFPIRANNNLPECVGYRLGSKTVYACGVCGKELTSRNFLSRHLKEHSQEIDFICTICGLEFIYKCNLKSHMRIHSDHRPYKCEVCEKTYQCPNDLKRHKEKHKPQFKCRYCYVGFKENYIRMRHEASHAPK